MIEGHATNNAPTFTSANANISSRTRTNAAVDWTPAPWTSVGEAGPDQQTPDIAAVIQEIINRPQWLSGNSLAVILSGSGRRTAESFNGDPNGAPLLHIDYTPGTGANQAPIVNAGSDQTVNLPNGSVNVTLNATVNDDGQPTPAQVDTLWTQEDGPGTVVFADANAIDTNASFDTAGSYTLRLSADDGDLTSFDELIVTVNAAGSATTLLVRVSASSDDAEENTATGIVDRGSSDLELVEQGVMPQIVGMRFNGLNIPRGATITNATLQFKVDEVSTGTTNLMIEGEATDDALTYTNVNANISSRNQTNAVVNWVPVAWSTVSQAGPDQQTPDLSAIIQEIINRPGWSSGNSLALMITGSGRRTAESFNGDAAGAALLEVTFTTNVVMP
jgi:hypothetical protein